MSDLAFMRHALALARRNLGQTWPNPAVGALVVKDGRILGTGWTARGGRPHAETQALAQAGTDARGATLYVTLEPCAHEGKTPPCTDAIIAAGIGRVAAGCGDPHPQVNGKGFAALRAAGVEVTEGVARAEALALNEGFVSTVTRGRPFVSMKVATSLDGRIGLRGGASQWLTCETSRAFAHGLRAEHDAVLTGIGTVLADDPLLTCRLPGMEDRSPVRVVLDRQGRLPEDCQLARSQHLAPLWVERECDDLAALLADLARRGITRLMVEAGTTLSTAFLRAGLVDRLYWLRAPLLMGADSVPAMGPLLNETLADCPRLSRVVSRVLDCDTLEVFEPCSPVL